MTEQQMLASLYQLERENEHRRPPEWLERIFPMWLLFYRKKAGKPRMRKTVTGACLLEHIPALRLKRNEEFSPIRKTSDGRKYRDIIELKPLGKKAHLQNNFNLIACLLSSAGEYSAVARNLKHKGYPKFVAAYYPTAEEIESHKDIARYHYHKYKDFDSLYRLRGFYDPQFMDLCDRLAATYTCNSLGQRRLL